MIEHSRHSSPTLGELESASVEFRGFDFFANREHNLYREASRAYFAEQNNSPSSWLGDATPPTSARPSTEDQSAPGNYNLRQKSQQKNEKKFLGFRRPWFWILIAIIAVVVSAAIGIGVGVASRRASSGSKSASAAFSTGVNTTTYASIPMSSTVAMMTYISTPWSSAITASTSFSTPSTTVITTTSALRTSSAHQPTTTQMDLVQCPWISNTVYEVPGSTKKFLRLCGVDYGKQDGAIDIGNEYTKTATDCINKCAATAGCEGCGWGYIEGDHGTQHRCWLKSNLGSKAHAADSNWQFAALYKRVN
ncbi:hypothetical protein GGS21DRAFT_12341 [Xylaria nigripes]|nr:hypothetical protein GGS21DRAFT_12341 [Xylaria nigripes]